MHRLILHNLGPVKDCDIAVNDFMVFTGPQASGKSTIAKAIFFFRTIKDEIWNSLVWTTGNETPAEWRSRLMNILTRKLERLLFLSSPIPQNLEMMFYYNDTIYISIHHSQVRTALKPIEFVFSTSISEYLRKLEDTVLAKPDWKQRVSERDSIYQLFNYSSMCQFIPAGRSLISSMSGPLSSLLASMDDRQKSEIDYSVQSYLNNIQMLQQVLKSGIDGLLADGIFVHEKSYQLAKKAQQLTNQILKGRYQYRPGEERFLIGPEEDDYVMLSQSSSGQQEAVWVTNIVFYHLVDSFPASLIVEEPESNLYPDTQKKMTELLSLFHNAGNQVLITTHSPYVLGTLNNLIYASDIAAKGVSGVEKIIDRDVWLNKDSISAWHMENGIPDPATEGELGLIRNEDIDGASIDLTEESDALYELSAREDAP